MTNRLLLIMTENDVNPPINNDPMEKRNKFINHPSYMKVLIRLRVLKRLSQNKVIALQSLYSSVIKLLNYAMRNPVYATCEK